MQLNFSVTMRTHESCKEQQLRKGPALTDKHSGSCLVKFWGLTSGSFKSWDSSAFRKVALLRHLEDLAGDSIIFC